MSLRSDALARFRTERELGRPLMGAGAGTGLSAKCEEAGGADLIIVYNSGRFRMAGLPSSAGSMPYGDANQIVVDLAAEVLPRVKSVPVVAGVAAGDPFRMMHVFVRQLEEMGFAGIQNFPTVGIHEGAYREHLESAGMGFDREVELIALAHERDLLTTPYAFTSDEAIRMAEAGADVIVAHVGRTVSGMVGAQSSINLNAAVGRIQDVADAARTVTPEILVLCHGGPLATAGEVQYLLDNTRGVDGFYGASSMERIPAERAITENMREFKALRAGRR